MPAPVSAMEESRPRPTGLIQSEEIAEIGSLEKPVGAIVAAAKVFGAPHLSERPAESERPRPYDGPPSRHRVHYILRTLQTASLVGYDGATRTSAARFRVLGTLLRRSTAQRPARHHVSADALGSRTLTGRARPPARPTRHRPRPSPVLAGASGMIMAALGNRSQVELAAQCRKSFCIENRRLRRSAAWFNRRVRADPKAPGYCTVSDE